MTAVPVRRQGQVVDRRIAGERFLVPIRGTLADLRGIFLLDEVGAFVWDRIDGRATVEEIGQAVSAEFEVETGTATADAESFLRELTGHGFVEGIA